MEGMSGRAPIFWRIVSKGAQEAASNPSTTPVREEPAASGGATLRIRSSIVAAIAVVSSFALFAPTAHAAGSVCYSAQVTVNGSDVVNQAACHDLP